MATIQQRIPEIAYIEDSADHLEIFETLLQQKLQRAMISHHFTPILVKNTTSYPTLFTQLEEKKPDILLLDYYLSSSLDAAAIAKNVKYFSPHTKIILLSAMKNPCLEEFQKLKDITKMFNTKTIDATADKCIKKEDITDNVFYKIRELLWKPLNIGVVGIGDFGLEYFDRDFADRVAVGSAR